MVSVNLTCMNYAGFYKEEGEFRKLCERLDKFDFSTLDKDHTLDSSEKEMLKRHAMEFRSSCFPMLIYKIDEAPGLNIIYVACNGLREEQLPDIEDAHRKWLKNRIASGWDNEDGREQVIIAAYAPGDDNDSPEQVVFLCKGVINPPAPGNDLHFSKVFHPDPPWDYDGDNAVLYEGMAYARQISATGSTQFLKFHTTESIKTIMGDISSIPEHDTFASIREFIPELERLCREADSIGAARNRSEISDAFNSLSSAMDKVIEDIWGNIGRMFLRSMEQRRQSTSSSPGSMAEGHEYGWSGGYRGDRAA